MHLYGTRWEHVDITRARALTHTHSLSYYREELQLRCQHLERHSGHRKRRQQAADKDADNLNAKLVAAEISESSVGWRSPFLLSVPYLGCTKVNKKMSTNLIERNLTWKFCS